MEVADRIAEVLRSEGRLVALGQLTQRLDAAEEEQAGSRLRTILASRPDRFVVLERPALFAGAEHWPANERAAYAEALRHAGFETQALVAEVVRAEANEEPAAADSPLSRVASSLAQVAEAAPEGLLRDKLWDSLPLAEATMRALAQAWQARQATARRGAEVTAQPSG
jgi:hypothetical protein